MGNLRNLRVKLPTPSDASCNAGFSSQGYANDELAVAVGIFSAISVTQKIKENGWRREMITKVTKHVTV